MSILIRDAWRMTGLVSFLAMTSVAQAAVTWQFDQTNTSLSLSGNTYVDNGANGFGPPNDDADNASASSYGPGAPNSVEASINPSSRDAGVFPTFSTVSSASVLTRFESLNSPSVTFTFNAVNVTDNSAGDDYLTTSLASGDTSVRLLFDNFTTTTPVNIDYSWNYDAISNPDHEAGTEDPERSRGTLAFGSSNGLGPGTVFSLLNTGPVTLSDSASGSWSDTINPNDYVTIVLSMQAETDMESPGSGSSQQDLAGAAFRGSLTLTVTTIPEPTTLAIFPLISIALAWRRAR